MIGLSSVTDVFSDMLKANRVPHGLLLCGPEGSGRASLALSLAQALNCHSPEPDFSPCRKCGPCVRISQELFPDVMTLEPKGRGDVIPIDDVRKLIDVLNYSPVEGRYKVAIIKKADRFRQEGGGALLKTLEEPVENTVLIMTAQSESGVMDTLVSRCVRLRVPTLTRKQIIEALHEKGLDQMTSRLLAGLSDGALGAALSVDPAYAMELWSALDGILGQHGTKNALKSALDWVRSFVDAIEKNKTKTESDRDKSDFVLDCLRLWWRDVFVLAATKDAGRMAGPPPTPSQRRWADQIAADDVARIEALNAGLQDGLSRAMRLELLFVNYWLNVLK
jgi:DNA polymerase III delta' subunit